jgi:glucosamine--fructose-6-phosphate aminotransferase (isomerizing)
MCGIFVAVGHSDSFRSDVKSLASLASRRGKDASGIAFIENGELRTIRSKESVKVILRGKLKAKEGFCIGHSRLATNSEQDNQPIVHSNVVVLHNGIVLNSEQCWRTLGLQPKTDLDSEVIGALAHYFLGSGISLDQLSTSILKETVGAISCVIFLPEHGKLIAFSNTGDLFLGKKQGAHYVSSERRNLVKIGCVDVSQVTSQIILNIPFMAHSVSVTDRESKRDRVKLPKLNASTSFNENLSDAISTIPRCFKCVLPFTMPFIEFDENGVCNYCLNEEFAIQLESRENLFLELEKLSRGKRPRVLVPFSGGRDSSFTLAQLALEDRFDLVTFTYDWGFVSDSARRNISSICAQFGVQNVLVAADIRKKRRNVRINLQAWLKNPHLGMISLLTAGDKFFFKYANKVQNELNASAQVWGINLLEKTQFKSGFLGIKPNFESDKLFSTGIGSQFSYQTKRFQQFLRNPSYFNVSLIDTLMGEYYRSISPNKKLFRFFDYERWDEEIINKTLSNIGWEGNEDSGLNWRVGDGTSAFYNYVYFKVAGFTENDTFRSNQIRRGLITREKALEILHKENQPRYSFIEQYLDLLDLDFNEVMIAIDDIPKLYHGKNL